MKIDPSILEAYFKMSDEIRDLAALLNHELYFGPSELTIDEWENKRQKLESWCDANLHVIYYARRAEAYTDGSVYGIQDIEPDLDIESEREAFEDFLKEQEIVFESIDDKERYFINDYLPESYRYLCSEWVYLDYRDICKELFGNELGKLL